MTYHSGKRLATIAIDKMRDTKNDKNRESGQSGLNFSISLKTKSNLTSDRQMPTGLNYASNPRNVNFIDLR